MGGLLSNGLTYSFLLKQARHPAKSKLSWLHLE
jgi:hypothetical protein